MTTFSYMMNMTKAAVNAGAGCAFSSVIIAVIADVIMASVFVSLGISGIISIIARITGIIIIITGITKHAVKPTA